MLLIPLSQNFKFTNVVLGLPMETLDQRISLIRTVTDASTHNIEIILMNTIRIHILYEYNTIITYIQQHIIDNGNTRILDRRLYIIVNMIL